MIINALASAASLFQSNSENTKLAYCLYSKQNLFVPFLAEFRPREGSVKRMDDKQELIFGPKIIP